MRRWALSAAASAAVVFLAGQAAAATFEYDFKVSPGKWSGALAAPTAFGVGSNPTLTGSFTVDDTGLTANGTVSGANAISHISSLSLTVGDVTYDASDLYSSSALTTFLHSGPDRVPISWHIVARLPGDPRLVDIASSNNASLYDPALNSDFYCNNCVSFTSHELAPASRGVPEPETWALLIVGFLGVGSILRRRRGQAAQNHPSPRPARRPAAAG